MSDALKASLWADLAAYDGKSVGHLTAVKGRFRHEPEYATTLIQLFDSGDTLVQDAATWLFKAFVEEQGSPLNLSEDFARTTRGVSSWPAQLHICQTIPSLSFACKDAELLADWLEPLLHHSRPFIRAWSVSALVSLAAHHPQLEVQANRAIKQAAGDASASVRARVRQLQS